MRGTPNRYPLPLFLKTASHTRSAAKDAGRECMPRGGAWISCMRGQGHLWHLGGACMLCLLTLMGRPESACVCVQAAVLREVAAGQPVAHGKTGM